MLHRCIYGTYNGDDKDEHESRNGLWKDERKNVKKKLKLRCIRGRSTMKIAVSRLPMVSFACATDNDTETCHISYECIYNDKSYPVT